MYQFRNVAGMKATLYRVVGYILFNIRMNRRKKHDSQSDNSFVDVFVLLESTDYVYQNYLNQFNYGVFEIDGNWL